MSLPDNTIADLAAELYRAEAEVRTTALISQRFPDMSLDDAYRVQLAGQELRLADGKAVIGHKVGLTSREMQRALAIEQPDFGVLYDDMLFAGDVVPTSRFVFPRVEMELAFVLGDGLSGPDCTIADVFAATAEIRPCFEILDSRVVMADPDTGRRRTIVDTVSDNAADAGLVLGDGVIDPAAVDVTWIPALCYRNNEIESSGVSGAVLGNPADAVAWLANALHGYGVSLVSGEIVLSGSFISPLPAVAGDVFRAVFADHGSVECRFE